jgi:RNA polymerase sigma factor (sigma-70 family)
MRPDELPKIAHEPEAFDAFYREHIEAVQRFVARRVGDPHSAADLTAETFLTAIHAAPTYRASRGEPRAWLFGIALNVVYAEHRRAGRERRANARIEGRRLLDADDVARIQERIDAERQSRLLYAALEGLPEGEREVFELHALDDLSPREAAAVLGIHPVTARVRLHRARVSLRGQLVRDEQQRFSNNLNPMTPTSTEG